jgi:hypothetical protein
MGAHVRAPTGVGVLVVGAEIAVGELCASLPATTVASVQPRTHVSVPKAGQETSVKGLFVTLNA